MRMVTVVDDEPMSLDVLLRAAKIWRYECQAAASAEQAIELLERRLTPVVVTDVRMPGRGGVWLVREIRRRWPEVSVIVVTAGEDEEARHECLDAGAQHYFHKPIHFDQFQNALETTLREQRRRKQRPRSKQPRKAALTSMLRLVEARDPYIVGHSLRVRRYSLLLADALEMPRPQRQRLSLAARLHDVGKIAIPETILHKTTSLSEEEFDIIKRHPLTGERILAPIIRSQVVLKAIRGHHERFDGAGYPDGLHGEKIPFLARILTVADSYDALTSRRAYRDSLSPRAAQKVIQDAAATQFDPHLVRVFIDRLSESRTK